MEQWQLNIQVDSPFRKHISKTWLKDVVARTLSMEPERGSVELDLLVTDGHTVRRLNRQYRGIDEETDVLAFSFLYPGHIEDGSELEDRDEVAIEAETFLGGDQHLGEIIVSYPQAVKQAFEKDHSVNKELALLVCHGVLHLLGYDHVEPQEEKAMRDMEDRIISPF